MNNTLICIDPACLGTMILIGVTPDYYGADREKHAEPQGYKYETMLPAHRFDKLTVKIGGVQQMDEPVSGQEPEVVFKDLKVRPYVDRNGRLAFTSTADGIAAATIAVNGKQAKD